MRYQLVNGGQGSGNFGHKGVEGQRGGSAPSELVAKYSKLLPKGHKGIKLVKRLPSFMIGNDHYTNFGRRDSRTGQIEISEQTPADEMEVTIAHEVAHEVLIKDINKMNEHMHFESDPAKGTRKIVRSKTAPLKQRKLMDFGEAVHKHGGLSEYGASFKSKDPKELWADNRENFEENLAEAFAGHHAGGKFREEAVRRNPKAMKIAGEYFSMK